MDEVRGGAAELRGDEARHLTRVLRVQAGQLFELSDNKSAYLAEVAEARGDRVGFRILEPLPAPVLPLDLTLCAALTKFDRFEWMLEKATELGVARILPVDAERSEKGLLEASHKRQERWMRIVREASQQSRRLTMPEILPAVRFRQALSTAAGFRCFLEEASAPPLLRALPPHRAAGDTAAVLLGPEGGWTDEERRAAAGAQWQPVSLGPTVLRAETAATAAVAVLMSAWIESIPGNDSLQ